MAYYIEYTNTFLTKIMETFTTRYWSNWKFMKNWRKLPPGGSIWDVYPIWYWPMCDLLAYLFGISIVNAFLGVLNSQNIFMKDIIFFWHCSIPIIFPFYQLAEPLNTSNLLENELYVQRMPKTIFPRGLQTSVGGMGRSEVKVYLQDWLAQQVTITVKAFTGLDRESAHLLQPHAVKRSCCTAANLGATGRLSPHWESGKAIAYS